ncbi:hypothetical protein K1T71_011942 [Dendrolimus kikuchii]|uniref:Uncharacterized protein n=1 Tax=Dendrolimus kikuchii TaxID=765133 RepID=A0ACC1CMI4_9NEOP|nr:hypothetical protein K1T71_011942 [Dendrolimus kikuchii]
MVQTRRNASVKDEINLPKVPAVTAKNIVTVDVHSKPMTVPLESGSIKSEIPVGNKMNVSRQCASLSRKSSSSIEARRKRLELQAAEAKARINMDLIEKRLAADIADLEDEKYSSHSEGNHSQHGNVEEWLERSQHELEAQADPRDGTDNKDGTVHILASALKDLAAASSSNNSNAQMLSRLCTPRDLPAYFGDPLEWLQFKQAFEESTRVCNFSDQENLWRLRKCLLGPAKDAVTALLISATSPTVVMSTLELQFGNPDIIISKIMYDIKKLPPVCPEYHKDIISFSIKVKNYVAAVLAIGQEEYLKGTNVTSIILSKLPTVLISKWADYSFKLIQEGMPLQITQGTPNGPYLTRTPLGWCVHGCVSTLQEGPHSMLFLSGSGVDGDSRESEKESLHDLHETVRQSFSIEAMGVSGKPRQNSEHVKAIKHLERTSMLKDGRWHVGLPWKDSSLNHYYFFSIFAFHTLLYLTNCSTLDIYSLLPFFLSISSITHPYRNYYLPLQDIENGPLYFLYILLVSVTVAKCVLFIELKITPLMITDTSPQLARHCAGQRKVACSRFGGQDSLWVVELTELVYRYCNLNFDGLCGNYSFYLVNNPTACHQSVMVFKNLKHNRDKVNNSYFHYIPLSGLSNLGY